MTLIHTYECIYCGDLATENEHVVPKSRGGRLTMPACAPCNRSKGNRDADEWFAAQLIHDMRGKLSDDQTRRLVAMIERLPDLFMIGVLDIGCTSAELAIIREKLLNEAIAIDGLLAGIKAAHDEMRAVSA
jgi:hypothetical protein